MSSILITGGCGFIGSNLACLLKQQYPAYEITVLDNLKRRGSELNLPRLKDAGIRFIHGDIRYKEDLPFGSSFDFIIDAAAEPSVLAGMGSGLDYIIDTNFKGTLNTLELAVQCKAKLIFLSTSRVYPIAYLESLDYYEADTRFELADVQSIPGISKHGLAENFPLDKARSVYGTTKLASEMMIQEYESFFGLEYVINRCGVVAGPYQMGKVDQGVVTLWVARHFWRKDINYIGFGGTGKQVRDVMHVYDLFDLVDFEMHHFEQVKGQVFNAGGGYTCSTSLFELSDLCAKVTGNKVAAHAVPETRQADIPWYITDNTKITAATGWQPKRSMQTIVYDTCKWIEANEEDLKKILL